MSIASSCSKKSEESSKKIASTPLTSDDFSFFMKAGHDTLIKHLESKDFKLEIDKNGKATNTLYQNGTKDIVELDKDGLFRMFITVDSATYNKLKSDITKANPKFKREIIAKDNNMPNFISGEKLRYDPQTDEDLQDNLFFLPQEFMIESQLILLLGCH
jgi:hypothetical protein